MKKVFIGFVLVGLLYLISNARDQVRGVTLLGAPTRHWGIPATAASSDDLKSNFEGAMIYNWLYAGGFVGLGVIGLRIHRHYERLDPLSPDFDP